MTEQDDAVVVESGKPDAGSRAELEVVEKADLTVETSDHDEADDEADDAAVEDDQADDAADDAAVEDGADSEPDAGPATVNKDRVSKDDASPPIIRSDDTQPLLLPPAAMPMPTAMPAAMPMPTAMPTPVPPAVPGQSRPAPATPAPATPAPATPASPADAPMTAPISLSPAPVEPRPGAAPHQPVRDDDGWDDDYLTSGTSSRSFRTQRMTEADEDWDVEQWALGAWMEPRLPQPAPATPASATTDPADPAAMRAPSPGSHWDAVPAPQISAPRGPRRLLLAGVVVIVVALSATAVGIASARSRPAASAASDRLQRARTAATAVLAADAPLNLKAVQNDLTTLITMNDQAAAGRRGLAWTIARWTTSPRRVGAVNRTADAMTPVADAGRLLSLSLARAYDGHTDPARLQLLATDLAAFARAADDAGLAGRDDGSRRMAVAASALQAIAADGSTQRWAVCPSSPRQCQRFEVKQGRLVPPAHSTDQSGRTDGQKNGSKNSPKGQKNSSAADTTPRSGDIQVIGPMRTDLRSSGYLSTPALVDLVLSSADPGDAHRPVIQRVSTLAPSG